MLESREVPAAYAEIVGGVLILHGTDENDAFTLTPVSPAGRFKVLHNGVSLGTFAPAANAIEIDGYTGNDSLAVNGTSAADNFQISTSGLRLNGVAIAIQNIEAVSLNGSSGSDKLTGLNQANVWAITGANAGILNSSASFKSIETIIGGDVDDRVIGPDQNKTWNLTGAGAGNIAATINFQQMEVFQGGKFNDTFNFSATAAGAIGQAVGGGGADVLAVTRNVDFVLSDDSLTLSDGLEIDLSDIGTARLTGVGSTQFTVSDWAGDGVLKRSGTGVGTVVAEGDFDVNLTNTKLIMGSAPGLTLTGVGVAHLGGSDGDNVFTVSGWTGTGSLAGNGGQDTVVVNKNAVMTLTSNQLAVAGGPSFALTEIGNAILLGNGGSIDASGFQGNTLLVGGASANTLKGGDGRSILIGGRGKDSLIPKTVGTVLIGGSTDIDASFSELAAALAEWRDEGNLSRFDSSTVHDDQAIDTLAGSTEAVLLNHFNQFATASDGNLFFLRSDGIFCCFQPATKALILVDNNVLGFAVETGGSADYVSLDAQGDQARYRWSPTSGGFQKIDDVQSSILADDGGRYFLQNDRVLWRWDSTTLRFNKIAYEVDGFAVEAGGSVEFVHHDLQGNWLRQRWYPATDVFEKIAFVEKSATADDGGLYFLQNDKVLWRYDPAALAFVKIEYNVRFIVSINTGLYLAKLDGSVYTYDHHQGSLAIANQFAPISTKWGELGGGLGIVRPTNKQRKSSSINRPVVPTFFLRDDQLV